jgi:hypothetical protein
MPISLSGPLYPLEHRKFAIPEIMRLFGVPRDFDFGWSTASEAAERMGLMVPPAMAEALFRSLLERVLRPNAERLQRQPLAASTRAPAATEAW